MKIALPQNPPLSEGLRALNVIVAADSNGGIGVSQSNSLPWHLPSDMKHFKEVTTKIPAAKDNMVRFNAVIMGRKTYESIPTQYKPLSNRLNIVISRTVPSDKVSNFEDVSLDKPLWVSSLEEAIVLCTSATLLRKVYKIFVIGGASIYSQVLNESSPLFEYIHSVYITRVEKHQGVCDVSVSELAANHTFWNNPALFHQEDAPVTQEEQQKGGENVQVRFEKWTKTNHEEHQYLNLIERIISHGTLKEDRTGVGTKSLFGAQMRFSLQNGRLPLLTTKRVFWRGVVEELFWFIKGDTNANNLRDKDIHIWDGNGSREFLDSLGLTDRKEGDLGPVYGFQWRHFGASYTDCDAEYSGKGVDQLKNIVYSLKNNPNDRRMLLCAWNPISIPLMALPPCHVLSQFYVANGKLSCQLYQRSADMGLGVPFNIASYSLLTILLAKTAGLEAGELIHTLGDAHVYTNHIEPLKQQLLREPRAFPYLHFRKHPEFLEDYAMDDIDLVDYLPYPLIKMDMAV